MLSVIKLPSENILPPVKILQAGNITCLYELGNLRYIRSGNLELIRKIFVAVRLHNWETLSYQIKDEKIRIDIASFYISYTAVYGKETALFESTHTIEGRPDNTIIFSMEGLVLKSLSRNRIGLCLLHPISTCRESKAAITQPDGEKYDAQFPGLIAPHQPFLHIREMQWDAGKKVEVNVAFEGEIFETEDQRNWSDSSYKTYSTPLVIPYPVQLEAGERLSQRITVRVGDTEENGTTLAEQRSQEELIPFPKIGHLRPATLDLTDATLESIRQLPFSHMRVSIAMDQLDWQEVLAESFTEAILFNTQLELVVVFTQDYKKELEILKEKIFPRNALVESILLLFADHLLSTIPLMQFAYPLLKEVFANINIGYGTDGSFANLNRNRPGEAPFDFLSFPVCPQMHSTDWRTTIENLGNQHDMIETAKQFCNGKPIHISALTLREEGSADLAEASQFSWFAAAWMVLSLQNLSAASCITLSEVLGESDLPSTDMVQRLPMYEAFSLIKKFDPAFVVKRYVNDVLLMDGLLLENSHGERLHIQVPDGFYEDIFR